MKNLFFIFISLIIIVNLNATIINVPADIDSIQGGINMASDGDTILVQPGTYYENINFIFRYCHNLHISIIFKNHSVSFTPD